MPQDAISAAVDMAREGYKRGGAKKIKVHKGPIHSSVAGRTDHLPMHVASGSYVIPADIISAMGEGNSMAGFKVAKSIFSVKGPYGQGDGMPYGGGEMPYDQPSPRKRAAGGQASGNPVASARAAAGDQRVINNRVAAANYAQQAQARDGTPMPSHLRAYAGANATGLAPLNRRMGQSGGSSGGTGSMGLPNPFPNKPNYGGIVGGLVGGPVGYLAGSLIGGKATGPADFINGGGLGASGDKFEGGLTSGAMNLLGVTPYAAKAGGGAAGGKPQSYQAWKSQNGGISQYMRENANQIHAAGGIPKMLYGLGAIAAGQPELGKTILTGEGGQSASSSTAMPQAAAPAPQPAMDGYMQMYGTSPYAAKAGGGPVEDHDAVPIVAAGGEYVISPEEVTHIGGGSMEDGHKILDAFVKKMRKKTIKTLQSLPGPKKD